jgi:hypothetical protein
MFNPEKIARVNHAEAALLMGTDDGERMGWKVSSILGRDASPFASHH